MITVDSIVSSLKIQPRFSDDEYDVMMELALRGVREIYGKKGLPVSYFPELNENRVATLPDDLMNYSKVGTIYNGRCYILGYNPKMCDDSSICGPGEQSGEPANLGFYFDNLYLPAQGGYGRLFGYPTFGNIYGEYNIDKENRQIQFSDDVLGTPVIEYRSTKIDITDGSIMLEPLAEEVIIKWTEMKTLDSRGTVPEAVIRRHKIEYDELLREYIHRRYMFTFQEFVEAIDEGYMQAPKH